MIRRCFHFIFYYAHRLNFICKFSIFLLIHIHVYIIPTISYICIYYYYTFLFQTFFWKKQNCNIWQHIMLNRGLLSHPTDTFTERMEDVDTDLQISSSQDSLMEAALAALGTGDMTPLVKEELKLTIQSRRLASGKGELRVNFEPPTQSEVRFYSVLCVF